MVHETSLTDESIASIENLTHEIAAGMGVPVMRATLIDGMPIGCADAHMLILVHEAKNHFVILHQDLSNARSQISEALLKIRTRLEQ